MKIALTRSYNKFGRSYPAGMIFEVKPEDFDPAFMVEVVEAKVAGTSLPKAPQSAVPTSQEPSTPAPLPPTTTEEKNVSPTVRRQTRKLPEDR